MALWLGPRQEKSNDKRSFSVSNLAKRYYTCFSIFLFSVQRVKRITLTIRPMDGVAYTFGSDDGSKEVHFSLNHIVNSHNGDTEAKKNMRVREEILGVLVHEFVHCYQYNGKGTAPGGLIEGIAGEQQPH